MSDWIQITGDRPGPEPVLVCRQGQRWVLVGMRFSEHGGSGWMAPGSTLLPGTPTHWQPLPAAMEAAA